MDAKTFLDDAETEVREFVTAKKAYRGRPHSRRMRDG